MANELSLFSNKPSYLANVEDDITKALMGGSGSSIKKISIKGGVWRMIVSGKEIAKNEERSMQVVIVNAAPKVAREYYHSAYQEGGDIKAPDCWSADGDVPDISIKEPQARRCIDCPMNAKGSGQNETRACRFSQKIAVVMANKLDGDVFQLKLPSTSIFGAGEVGKWPMQSYAKILREQGVPIPAVVTEMRFDTDSATPKLTFKPIRLLDEEEFQIASEQGKTDAALKAIATVAIEPNSGKLNTPRLESKPVVSKDTVPAAKPKAKAQVTDSEEEIQEPVKRKSKKTEDFESETPKAAISDVLSEWDDM